jgi:hypothetical protein
LITPGATLDLVKRPWLATGPLLAALAWWIALAIDPGPFSSPASAFLIGFGMITCGAVSVVGMILNESRWAHRLAWGVVAYTVVPALARPIDMAWFVGLSASVGAAIGLVLIKPGIRRLPSATGPGERAVLIPIFLLAVPALLGVSVPGPSWALLLLGLGSPVGAYLYSRVVSGGLLAVRVVWPLVALAVSPLLFWPGPLVMLVIAGLITALAWHPSVKAAFHPPREVGSTFPIPPELAPREVLDAARIDDTGKPL